MSKTARILLVRSIDLATGEDVEGYRSFAECVSCLRVKAKNMEEHADSPLFRDMVVSVTQESES